MSSFFSSFPEPMKGLFRHEMANAGAHGKPKVEETACGLIGIKSTLLVSK